MKEYAVALIAAGLITFFVVFCSYIIVWAFP
jgi:low affinity Fe/Cu permease